MVSTDWEDGIRQLRDDLLAVADLTAEALRNAIAILRSRDKEAALAQAKSIELVHSRLVIDRNAALALLGAKRPEGRGKLILKALPDVCLQLDRIGWYAQGIVQLAARPDRLEAPALLVDLELMSCQIADLLRQAVRAFAYQDSHPAQIAAAQIPLLRTLADQIYYEGLKYMIEVPATTERVRLLLTASHDLQCVARRVGRICDQAFLAAAADLRQAPTLTLSDVVLAAS